MFRKKLIIKVSLNKIYKLDLKLVIKWKQSTKYVVEDTYLLGLIKKRNWAVKIEKRMNKTTHLLLAGY